MNIMKTLFLMLFGFGMGNLFINVNAQESKEHLSKEFTLTGEPAAAILQIYNISGSIKIEGTGGNKVNIETDKTISAENEKDLETGKKEFRLNFEQKNDTITAYIASPFDSRPRRNNYNNDHEINYDYNVDFSVKVPSGINLRISTVNNGIVLIENVNGVLNVNNVNEEIKITNAGNTTHANTVNGDVTVTYLKNPPEESSFTTINGDINVTFREDLSADIQFKTMNGDLYTDFPAARLLPAAVKKVQEKRNNSTVYKLSSETSVRYGKGGKTFRFETLNGSVYIKKS